MGGKKKIRGAFNVITLLQDARAPGATTTDPTTAVLTDSRSTSPLRQLLERGSSTTYLTDLHQVLVAEGLAGPIATHTLTEVINGPSLSLNVRREGHRCTDVLQAVLLQTTPGEFLLAVVSATVSSAKPPAVERSAASVMAVDPDADAAEVAALAEGWWSEYGLRSPTPPPSSGTPTRFGWLGDPMTSGGYQAVPAAWTARVKAMAAVLGMASLEARTPAQARAQSLHERLDVAFLVRGAGGWADLHERLEAAAVTVLTGGVPGTRFEDLLTTARGLVVRHALDSTRPTTRGPRELHPGESVFHKKVGNSGGSYDHFDDGSPTPCVHGADAFIRFSGADKALKGMQRIYADFDKSMLYHCNRFPNCGMYGAIRAVG